MTSQDLVVGIDASRNRSGGAKAHLIGILSEGDPRKHGIRKVHVWAYQSLMNAIPDRPWLIKHVSRELEQSLPKQLWWQATGLVREVKKAGCDILFTTDASTLCRFRPMVVLSQDMLSYEPGVMRHFGYTKARLRLLAILFIQNRAFRFADGVIFLTHYAGKIIQQSCGPLLRVAYIPHGVGQIFKCAHFNQAWPETDERPIRCIYVSNAEMYKHQWIVVRAVEILRRRGHNLTLTLIGGGSGTAQKLLEKQLTVSDPDRTIVTQLDFVSQKELLVHLINSDLFIFASSCENMPVTLIEAMSVGLPIACSNRGPMPEVLDDGGIYFDPEDAEAIANAIETIITEPILRRTIAQRAKNLAAQYSWVRCADETFSYVVKIYNAIINRSSA